MYVFVFLVLLLCFSLQCQWIGNIIDQWRCMSSPNPSWDKWWAVLFFILICFYTVDKHCHYTFCISNMYAFMYASVCHSINLCLVFVGRILIPQTAQVHLVMTDNRAAWWQSAVQLMQHFFYHTRVSQFYINFMTKVDSDSNADPYVHPARTPHQQDTCKATGH